MIARIWRGVTPRAKTADYVEYINKTGVTDCRATPGNQGVLLFCRPTAEESEFLFISLWESMDAIRRFAGDDIEKARYYPEDADYLVELEPTVTHYDVHFKS